MTIGDKIKELRTNKKITQEELAKKLNISTQAVSKWECGGSPDLELIPLIAKYFNVTTDYLFDIKIDNYDNMDQLICNYISSLEPQSERVFKIYQLGYYMTIGSCHETNIKPYNAKEIMEKGDYYSLCKLNTGTSFVSIKKNNPFFAIFPRPESGYYNQMLDSKTLQIQFLKECGNEDFYNTLVYLNTRKNSNFTDKLLEKELNITSSRSKEIINILLKYNLLKTTELELDDTKIITYNLNDNPAIIGFFAFLDLLVTQQRGYYFGVYDGQGEYFK